MQKVALMPVEDMNKLLEVLGDIIENQSISVKPIFGNLIELSA